MKKFIAFLIFAVALFSITFAQTDTRSRETKIADIVMLLPANNTDSFNKLMDELLHLGDVIGDLAPRLVDSGDGDTQIRYAISGLSMYASQRDALKPAVANSLCDAIPKATSDEIRDFLFIQLQYVAGEESVERVANYLTNPRLADAAARVLVRTGSAASGKALLSALEKATGAQKITLIQALGEMRHLPANDFIATFVSAPSATAQPLPSPSDTEIRKASLYALSQIAHPASEKILSQAAARAGFRFESSDALGAYLRFLQNNLAEQPLMVTKSAQKVWKATSETSQIAAKTAALELLTHSAGEKSMGYIITAMKSSNAAYRQAALQFSKNIGSPTMYADLLKIAQKEKRAEVKAEIVSVLGERGDQVSWSFIQQCLAADNNTLRAAAITAAGKFAGANAVLPIVQAMNTSNQEVVSAGKHALLSIADNEVIVQVAAALPNASNGAKVAFLEILASRRAESNAAVVFAQTSSTNGEVRLAAYKALASVVSVRDASRVAQLLNNSSDKEEVAALQRALFSAVSSQSQEMQTDLIIDQAISSNRPANYGHVFAMVGGRVALDIVMEYGFHAGDPTLREAAFESLLNWSDDVVIPQLYKIAADNPGTPYFDRALLGYTAKTGLSKEMPEQKLLMLRNGLEIAQTPLQKRTLLRQIARTGTFVGLTTAGRFLNDPSDEVQQAAVQAINAIALAHPEYYGPQVISLLERGIAINKDPEAEYQKEAILKHLAALPQAGGFESMFNEKDLSGWQGLVENPIARANMSAKELAQKQEKADEIMRRDWKVENGVLVFDGPGYDNLCSIKDYADFEMYIDWRIHKGGDSGLYLRGSPQVQIWDTALTNVGAQVGSGGLYNNTKHLSEPLIVADNPVDEWNSFYIKMIGEKVTIYLNGQLVTDNVTLENYWNRHIPIFERGPIELQAHTERVEFRDIYIREIPRATPYRVSEEEKAQGFVPIFNGMNMLGWTGNLTDYVARDGAIVCDPIHGGNGNLYTEKEYANFILRFDFLLTPAANNGIGIRAPLEGDAAYVGMEIQVLDNEAEVYRNLREYQYHGSVYGVIPAKRGHLKPVGEWNTQEIIADGNHIKVTLNGVVILDGDISDASNHFTQTIDGQFHPGLSNTTGHIGFLGHGSWVAFRNLRIKELIPSNQNHAL